MSLHLKDPGFSTKLIAAYLKDTGFLRKDIVKRELEAPAFLMENICEESEVRRNYGIDPDTLRPMGKVVVFLPKNGINLIVSKAICSSYLAGNETFGKLPTRLLNSTACFKQLLEDFLPGVKVVGEGKDSANFLKDCIDSSEIDSIVIYGDDKSGSGLIKMEVRTVRTKTDI